FEETVGYFGIKPKPGEKEITPNYVFTVWYEFCSDFKTIWKRESKSISKERSNGHQGKIIPSGCVGKFTKGTLSPQKDKHI
ncbi:hypothetical protein CIB84_014217, partial [Bambusicola thoracicus]